MPVNKIQLQRLILGALPPSIRLPFRYWAGKVFGTLERELLSLRALTVGECRRAIDIGANHGLYTYKLAALFDNVEAFEPQPWCAKTIQDWDRDNVSVNLMGLSNVSSELELHIPIIQGNRMTGYASFQPAGGDNSQVIKVPVRTLDEFRFNDVDFIKIDVEGHESFVIEGAKETILRCSPTLLIEIEQRHLGSISIYDVFAQITDLGYQGFYFYADKLRTLKDFSYERDQRSRLDGNCPQHEYINNFIFFTRERAQDCGLLAGQ